MLKCYTEGDLYKQLRYLQFMFDLPRYEQSRTLSGIHGINPNGLDSFSFLIYFLLVSAVIRTTSEIEDAFKYLKEYVERILNRSAYQSVKLSEMFKQMHPEMLVVHIPSPSDATTIEIPEN